MFNKSNSTGLTAVEKLQKQLSSSLSLFTSILEV